MSAYEPYPLKVALLETSVGAAFVYLVWALKPGEPRIVAICTTEAKAQRYIDHRDRRYEGWKMLIERVPLDHAFGYGDLQTMIYAGKAQSHD